MLGVAMGREPNHLFTAARSQILPRTTLAADCALLTAPPQRTAANTQLGLGVELTVTCNLYMLCVSKRNDLFHDKHANREGHAPSKTEPRQFNHSFNKHV